MAMESPDESPGVKSTAAPSLPEPSITPNLPGDSLLEITFASTDLPERLIVTTKRQFLSKTQSYAFGCIESECGRFFAYREHVPAVNQS